MFGNRLGFTSLLLTGALLSGCGGNDDGNQPQPVAYPSGLNDSGRAGCASATQAQSACGNIHPGQDAQFGRDAAQRAGELLKLGGGDHGFDFSRLDGGGTPLLSQSGLWSATGTAAAGSFWECVRDNATGLTWEVKHSNPTHPRWVGSTYSWYNSDNRANGGIPGTMGTGACNGGRCDTTGYVDYLNELKLCGFNDWRLPQVGELLSIAHHGRENPAVDPFAFPNASDQFLRYWTADTVAEIPQIAWYVYFSDGSVSFTQKDNTSHLRLVRSDND